MAVSYKVMLRWFSVNLSGKQQFALRKAGRQEDQTERADEPTFVSIMATRDSSRIMLLEEEVRSLTEELVQCQADKEFVWSLWKRLQVANPDLTQAVSLVVEREKWKAEAKDRKVLEILQAKDYKIQELDQGLILNVPLSVNWSL
ncbi:unnamed protein product [Coregonus sp. 'balchen']|nr:unnamed protein product [Coregonus sp. 'balchen']